jgi:ABC-type multidrug transport system ATPase subunit
LALALLHDPELLLLDEPTAALDPASVARAETLLASCLADGMAVLIVTHSAEQAQRLADRVFHLEDGRLTTA